MILQRSILQQKFSFFYHFDFIIALFKTNLIASVACMLLLFMFDWLFMQLKYVSKRRTTKRLGILINTFNSDTWYIGLKIILALNLPKTALLLVGLKLMCVSQGVFKNFQNLLFFYSQFKVRCSFDIVHIRI